MEHWQKKLLVLVPALATACCLATSPVAAAGLQQQADGSVTIDQQSFADLTDYVQSDYFRATGKRCGTRENAALRDQILERSVTDCTTSLTVLQDEYWPKGAVFTIPIWWHVISGSDGTGIIADAAITAQMQALNEDYRARVGTKGSQGYDIKIEFTLAGIDRTVNDTWFADMDESGFKQALIKDPDHYLNVYTNNTQYLGYAYYPQDAAGQTIDGIVLLYQAVGGRDNGFSTYDQGRTLVHEMGHYLGLQHTFEGGAACSNTYASGDLIVDTPAESEDHYGCSQTYTCGTPDPIYNYMNYTNDTCMRQFSREQANRAVCGLVNYRPNAYTVSGGGGGGGGGGIIPPLLMPLLFPAKK